MSMETTVLIGNITMWIGSALGLLLGIYLNVKAYQAKKMRSQKFIKSYATIRRALVSSSEIVVRVNSNNSIKHKANAQNSNQIFEGNLVLKSQYAYDCV